MTRQANNIVSFDEARRASGARRSVASNVGRRTPSAAPRSAVYDERAYREDLRKESRASRSTRANEDASTSASSDQVFDDFFGKMGERAQKAKRQAAKAKADREFTKHYGADHSSAGESGPRAAVYKGEMGSQHRRASRMQSGVSALGGLLSVVRLPSVSLSALASKSTIVAGLALVFCLFACGVFLYQPAQQLYQEVRDRDRLAVEYAAVSARNEAIESEVRALSTPEGIQDRARKEFGWISEGEYAVSVTGLGAEKSYGEFQATINAASIQAPDTWYSDFLDPFFGYE